jgi:O-succinylbenzoic acid--CoA ligase
MPDTDTILPNWLARAAENFPQHLAIKYNDISWSFAELDRQATLLARQYATLGVGPNTRVAILANSGLPFVTTVHALTRLGAILIPLNLRLTHDELLWQLRDVHADLLISDLSHQSQCHNLARSIPTLRHTSLVLDVETQTVSLHNTPTSNAEIRTTINLSDIQAIMYTSGTTGTPKGVIITYGMQWWNAIGSVLTLEHHADDCWLACMPLFHIGGLAILMRSVINAISVVLLEKFDARQVNQSIQQDHITIISVVAVMLQRMLAELDKSHSSYPLALRCVLLGGGPAPQPLLEDCARRSIPVVQTYGLTESCSQAVTLSPTDALRKLGSAGRPLIQLQIRIMEDSTILPPNTPGTIYLKGPSITPGYDHRPDATASTIHDGWLSTGDIGYLDPEGYLYVLDRRNDLIISGGENIYPAEIEATLLSHPSVLEAGVCGQSDPQWGQVPVAFVVLRSTTLTEPTSSSSSFTTSIPDKPSQPNNSISSSASTPFSQSSRSINPTPADLIAYLSQRLARYKLPRAIYLVDSLPRTSSGKLLRRSLPSLIPTQSTPDPIPYPQDIPNNP